MMTSVSALVHGLVFVEADALDEALYAGVHRRDVLFHLCVVGIFHARMEEAGTYIDQSGCQQADDDDVIDQFFNFSGNHDGLMDN